ncbi:hypothetical protein STRDD04_00815 [Streptococcus sp. DD04]|nr:hypothetical protein STRDD04_00815 [Streptococcus sp. DD04]
MLIFYVKLNVFCLKQTKSVENEKEKSYNEENGRWRSRK